MTKVLSTHILAVAPTGDQSPDSITIGDGSVWVEYGNGANSAGGGTSQVVQYSMQGQVRNTYTVNGLADGLKVDPLTGDIWVLNNNDGNASLQIINPATNQISAPLLYGAPYVSGASSSRGFDDVAFVGKRVFLSETNPVNPGDAVVVELLNGTAPIGTLQTQAVLSLGDMGIDVQTGQLAPVPITDPDSLKTLADGSLLLTGEADGTLIFIKHPLSSEQSVSFLTLPAGFVADDAIQPNATRGTFTISNQGANDVVTAQVSGLVPTDLYADITNQNELVQIDPSTGAVTTVLSGLNNPHGLAFTAAPDSTAPGPDAKAPPSVPSAADTPQVLGTHIVAVAPTGDSAPDSITLGDGSIWVEYGNGADGAGGGGTSQVVQYSKQGQVEQTYTADGLADGVKYDPVTGNVWVLNNNDGNANLQFINPATNQISGPLTYAAPYVYGANSTRGYDDAVFLGQKVFLSMTNPVNPGDPVVEQLLNGTAPVGQLETSTVLSFGDTGVNVVTGQTETLPITDPDSLKALPNGSLMLTGEADGSLIFIKDPGTTAQTASFLNLPTGFVADDAIVPDATSGIFYISNQGANDVLQVQLRDLNPHDIYADIANQNELVQIDPTNGNVTTVLAGLNNPHGLAFAASGPLLPFGGHG